MMRYERKGATSGEYALIAAVIAAVIITSCMCLGTQISSRFTNTASSVHGQGRTIDQPTE